MVLTWRNVDAPDFGRSLEGIRTFGNLFGDAISGLDRGIATFDAAKDREANSAFAMDLLKFQDPAAYKAALASGSVFAGVDPRRLSQASIASAGSRVNELLGQKTAEMGIEREAYGFDRRKMVDGKMDAAAPLLAGAYSAAREGQGKFDEYIRANPALANLPYNEAQALISGSINTEAKGVDIASGRLGMDQTRQNMRFGEGRFKNEMTEFGWRSEDRELSKQVDAALMGADLNSMDPASAQAYIRGLGITDPRVYNAAIQRVQGLNFGTGGGTPAAGMLAAATGGDYSNVPFAAVKDMIGGKEGPDNLGGYGAIAYNTPGGKNAAGVPNPGKPLTEMTLGEVFDFQRGPMRQATRGRRGPNDVGSTGVGKYQFESMTLAENAEKAFGKDWRSQKFSPQVQDRIAETLFDRVKGNPAQLRNTWAAFQNAPSPQQLQMSGAATAVGLTTRAGERNANSMAPAYMAAINDTRPPGEVIAGMKKNSIYKGKSENELLEMIQMVQNEAAASGKAITPAYAAAILEQNPRSNNPGMLRKLINTVTDPFGLFDYSNNNPAPTPNRGRVSEAIRAYGSGQTQSEVMGNVDAGIVGAQLQQYQQAYALAQQRLAQARQAALSGRRVDVRALEADVMRIGSIVGQYEAGLRGDPARTSFGAPPAPPPRPVVRNRPATSGTPVRTPRNAEERRAMWMQALGR